METTVTIKSTGSYLPKKVLTNQELSLRLGLDPSWITQRTGVLRRHVAAQNESTSDLATHSAKQALLNAQMNISDVDLILVSTGISDTTFPPTACRVHRNLKAKNIPAMDISASCSGFLYGATTAIAYIKSGMAKTVLLSCAELRSKFINYRDPDTASVYGDGSGSVILTAENNCQRGFLDIAIGADGKGAEAITIPAGGTKLPPTHETVDNNLHYIHFHDRSIIKSAVRGVKKHVESRIKHLGINKEQIDVVIPHQMNLRMLESLSKRMGIDRAKFVINIEECGNTSSASIPIALNQGMDAGKIKPGQLALFLSYGAGFTWGSGIYQF